MSTLDDRPQALFFDLGRVLVGYDWSASMQRLADRLNADGRPTTTDDLVRWMLGPDGPHDPYCLGRIDTAALLDAIHRRFDPEQRIDDAWLVDLWCDMFEPWPEALSLVDRVRGQAALALVSNTNPLHFDHLDQIMDLRDRFDHVTVSYEIGAMKPAAVIFEDALHGTGTAAGHAWFTDDLETNLVGARALGIRTHLFDSVDRMRSELAALGFEV